MKVCDVCNEDIAILGMDEDHSEVIMGKDLCGDCAMKLQDILNDKPELISKFKSKE